MEHNSLSQDTELRLIQMLVPHLTHQNFVDVGAEKGVFASIMLELGLAGILFEPMPKHLTVLQKLVDGYQGNAKLYTCAITAVDGTQQFHVATDASGQELDYYHSLQKAEAPGVFSHSKAFEVECRSLQSLVMEEKLPAAIGVLKTDTEGNDLNVLRGLGTLRPELVICEYFMEGMYSGWNEGFPQQIIEYMHTLGYQNFLITKRVGALEFLELNTRAYHEKQWGNLLFFREDFFLKAKEAIAVFLLENEKKIVNKIQELDKTCAERLDVINLLDAEVKRLCGTKEKKRKVGWCTYHNH
jgi:FkbM family methyltransferase